MKKENIIRTQNYEEIGDSYKWENKKCKNTFPASLWVSALINFLYDGLNTNDLEDKYTNLMAKVNKKSNTMYINSLLRKMQIDGKQNSQRIRDYYSKQELEKWIVDRINQITKKHYTLAVPKAKKWIEDWNIYYYQIYISKEHSYNDEIAQKIKIEHSQRLSNHWHNHKLEKNINSIDKMKNWDENKKIQEWGKFYFYDELISKFGLKNVFYNSEILKNNNSTYDFLVIKNDKKHYYEVRTTKRSTLKFKLSRSEYEFWKKCQESNHNYSLISIKNLYYYRFSNLPIIEEIKNPKFKISIDNYGFKNGNVLIAPNEFVAEI